MYNDLAAEVFSRNSLVGAAILLQPITHTIRMLAGTCRHAYRTFAGNILEVVKRRAGFLLWHDLKLTCLNSSRKGKHEGISA